MNKKLKAVGFLLALGLSFPTITQPATSFAAATNTSDNQDVNKNVNTDSTQYFKLNTSSNNGIIYDSPEQGVKFANLQYKSYNPQTREVTLNMTFNYKSGAWGRNNRYPDAGTINLTFRNLEFKKKISSISIGNTKKPDFEVLPNSKNASFKYYIDNLGSLSSNTTYSYPITIKLNDDMTETDKNTIVEMVWINVDARYDPYSQSTAILKLPTISNAYDLPKWVDDKNPVVGRVLIDKDKNIIKTVHAVVPHTNLLNPTFDGSTIYLSDQLPKELIKYFEPTVKAYRSDYSGLPWSTGSRDNPNHFPLTLGQDGLVSTKSNPNIGTSAKINDSRAKIIANGSNPKGLLYSSTDPNNVFSIEYTFEYKIKNGYGVEDVLLELNKLSQQGNGTIYSWQEYENQAMRDSKQAPKEIKFTRHGQSFSTSDSDKDGLIDELEISIGTDPNDPDTDKDGVPDGLEVNKYKTNPKDVGLFKLENPTLVEAIGSDGKNYKTDDKLVIRDDTATSFRFDIMSKHKNPATGERLPVSRDAVTVMNVIRFDPSNPYRWDESNVPRLLSGKDIQVSNEALNNPNAYVKSINPADLGLKAGDQVVFAFKPQKDLTLRAFSQVITIESFGVFNANGGSFDKDAKESSIQVDRSNKKLKLSNSESLPKPTREGKVFLGYSTKANTSPDEWANAPTIRSLDDWKDTSKAYNFDKDSPIDSTKNLYAVWEDEGFAVNFKSNDGSKTQRYNYPISKIEERNGRKYIRLPNIDSLNDNIKTNGQEFRGWAKEAGKNEPFKLREDKFANTKYYIPTYIYNYSELDITDEIDKGEINLYAVYAPKITITATKEWKNLNNDVKPNFYVGLIRSEAIGAQDDSYIDETADYYPDNNSYSGFSYVNGSAKAGADTIRWDDLDAYSPKGRRYNYLIIEGASEEVIKNFNGDWASIAVNFLKTDSYPVKRQSVSLQNGSEIDAFSAATQRSMDYEGDIANPSLINGYSFKVTNTKEEIANPSIFTMYEGDNFIYLNLHDEANKLQKTTIKVRDKNIILNKTNGKWTSDDSNVKISYVDEEGNQKDDGRYLELSFTDGFKLALNDKVTVTSYLNDSVSRSAERTVVKRPDAVSPDKLVQQINEGENLILEAHAPSSSSSKRDYTLEIMRDGKWEPLNDSEENPIKPDLSRSYTLRYAIPKSLVKDGDVFRIKTEANRLNTTYNAQSEPIDITPPTLDESYEYNIYVNEPETRTIKVESGDVLELVGADNYEGISFSGDDLRIDQPSIAKVTENNPIEFEIRATDYYGNASSAPVKINVIKRETSAKPIIEQIYDDSKSNISYKITGIAGSIIEIEQGHETERITLDKESYQREFLIASLGNENVIKARQKEKEKYFSDWQSLDLDIKGPVKPELAPFTVGDEYIRIKEPDNDTKQLWLSSESSRAVGKIKREGSSWIINGHTLKTENGYILVSSKDPQNPDNIFTSREKIMVEGLDNFGNRSGLTSIRINLNLKDLENTISQVDSLVDTTKLDENNPLEKELKDAYNEAKKIASTINNDESNSDQHVVDDTNKRLKETLEKYKKDQEEKNKNSLLEEIKRANEILARDNSDDLTDAYKKSIKDALATAQEDLKLFDDNKSLTNEQSKKIVSDTQVLKELNDKPLYKDVIVVKDTPQTKPEGYLSINFASENSNAGSIPNGYKAYYVKPGTSFSAVDKRFEPKVGYKFEDKWAIKGSEGIVLNTNSNYNLNNDATFLAISTKKDDVIFSIANQAGYIQLVTSAENGSVYPPKAGDKLYVNATKDITLEQAVKGLKLVAKEDYTFEKWVDQNGNTLSPDTIIDSALFKKLTGNELSDANNKLPIKAVFRKLDQTDPATVSPALRDGDITITGTAPANTIVSLTLPDGKIVRTFADDEGNFRVNLKEPGLTYGQTVTVATNEEGKLETKKEFVVGTNTDKLNQAIKEAKDLIPDQADDNESMQDKKLRKAIKNGEEVKNDKTADQDSVDAAEKAIRDAIGQKEKADQKDDLLNRLNQEIAKAEAILSNEDSADLNPDYKKQLEDTKLQAENDRDYLEGKEGLADRSDDKINEDINELSKLNESPIYNTGEVYINELKETDTQISGTAPANSAVTISLPNGNKITTKADEDGKYAVEIRQPGLKYGDTVKVEAKDRDRNVSVKEITVKANKDDLNEAITRGEDLIKDIPEEKTPADEALEKAINNGKNITNNNNPSQDEVNQATEAINQAIDHKNEIDSLKEKIDEANDYLPDEEVQKAIDKAKEVINNNGDKDAIDQAKKNLEDAINGKKGADKQNLIKQLEEEIRKAEQILSNDKEQPLEKDYKQELEDAQLKAQNDLDYLNGKEGLKDRTNADITKDIDKLKNLNDNPQYKGQSGEISLKENPVNGTEVIEGQAPANSPITLELPGGVSVKTTSDENGNFTINLPAPLKQGQVIKIISEEEGKLPSTKEVRVGADKKALNEAITRGEEAISQTRGEKTPADDKLQKAIEDAKTTKNSEDVDQETVDKSTQAIYDALKEKENRDELKDLIVEAKSKVTNDKTPVDNNLINTINEAVDILNDANATAEQIQDAKDKLREAISNKEALSNERIIPYEPTNLNDPANQNDSNIPKVDQNGNAINRDDYAVIGLRTDGKGKINGKYSVSYLVRKGMTFEEFIPSLKLSGNDEDTSFWKWNKVNSPNLTGEISDGYEDTARFISSGQRISGSDDIPDNYYKVTVNRKTSVTNNPLFGKVYAVKAGNNLQADRFPEEINAVEGYAKAHWIDYNTKEKIENPSTMVINQDSYFLAQANKRIFDERLRVELLSTRLVGKDTLDVKVDKDTTKIIATINGGEMIIHDKLILKAGDNYQLKLSRPLQKGDILSISLENNNNDTYSTQYEWSVRR